MSTIKGNKLFSFVANLSISTINVIGENKEKIKTINGSDSKGIKIPLINNNGNFKRFIINITSEVFSVGLAETNIPNNDPINPIKIIATKIKRKAEMEKI
jgi:hypothetical protein